MPDWLKLHRRAEKELSKLLRRYLKAQNKRLLSSVRSLGALPGVSYLNSEDERKALIDTIDDCMLGIMGAGAYRAHKSLPQTKSFKLGKRILAALSAAVVATIKAVWERIKGLFYWNEIANGQEELAKQIIAEAVQDGLSQDEIEKRLKAELAAAALLRAAAIATGEATMALNAGARAVLEEAADAGRVSGLIWRTQKDDRVRESHAALEGTEISADGTFDVGGNPAAYPGDPALPVAERAGCRCELSAG